MTDKQTKPVVKVFVTTNYVGCQTEEELTLDDLGINQDEWDKMDQEARGKIIKPIAEQWMWQEIEMGWVIK